MNITRQMKIYLNAIFYCCSTHYLIWLWFFSLQTSTGWQPYRRRTSPTCWPPCTWFSVSRMGRRRMRASTVTSPTPATRSSSKGQCLISPWVYIYQRDHILNTECIESCCYELHLRVIDIKYKFSIISLDLEMIFTLAYHYQ